MIRFQRTLKFQTNFTVLYHRETITKLSRVKTTDNSPVGHSRMSGHYHCIVVVGDLIMYIAVTKNIASTILWSQKIFSH